jgi:hypothetical protein
VLNYQIITSEGAAVASTVTCLLPIVAIILGVLILNEHVTLLVIFGVSLILLGVALTRKPLESVVRHAWPVMEAGHEIAELTLDDSTYLFQQVRRG